MKKVIYCFVFSALLFFGFALVVRAGEMNKGKEQIIKVRIAEPNK